MTETKSLTIRIGDFFFKYRNTVFPILLLALFVAFPFPPTSGLRNLIAILLVAIGLIVRGIVIGYAYIKRGGLDKKVYADRLVTEGMFQLCRNPLYVGNMLIYFGVMVMHGHWFVIVFGTVLFFWIYTTIIATEENFLRAKFGAAYSAYCKSTPRWGIKFWRWSEATQGMQFNFRRWVTKDYSTIGNAVFAILALEFFKIYKYKTGAIMELKLGLVAAGVTVCGLFLLITRALKKSRRLKSS